MRGRHRVTRAVSCVSRAAWKYPHKCPSTHAGRKTVENDETPQEQTLTHTSQSSCASALAYWYDTARLGHPSPKLHMRHTATLPNVLGKPSTRRTAPFGGSLTHAHTLPRARRLHGTGNASLLPHAIASAHAVENEAAHARKQRRCDGAATAHLQPQAAERPAVRPAPAPSRRQRSLPTAAARRRRARHGRGAAPAAAGEETPPFPASAWRPPWERSLSGAPVHRLERERCRVALRAHTHTHARRVRASK